MPNKDHHHHQDSIFQLAYSAHRIIAPCCADRATKIPNIVISSMTRMIITIPTNHREEIKEDRVTRTSEAGANGVGRPSSIMTLQSRGRKRSCIEGGERMRKVKGPDWNEGERIKRTTGERGDRGFENGPGENSGNDRTRAPVRGSPVVQTRISRSADPLDGLPLSTGYFTPYEDEKQ
ncbi:hypothetical protein K0M31_012386 [Melipona bicolor]|uniref:Uncharacterized protein n=1 Tax=Melipona bicolor TaxID=60889 RepID=A0AA40FJT5_9HYME|nr:hypothetical protein K0M31_012386 [Melipona bicolor]